MELEINDDFYVHISQNLFYIQYQELCNTCLPMQYLPVLYLSVYQCLLDTCLTMSHTRTCPICLPTDIYLSDTCLPIFTCLILLPKWYVYPYSPYSTCLLCPTVQHLPLHYMSKRLQHHKIYETCRSMFNSKLTCPSMFKYVTYPPPASIHNTCLPMSNSRICKHMSTSIKNLSNTVQFQDPYNTYHCPSVQYLSNNIQCYDLNNTCQTMSNTMTCTISVN